MVPSHAERQWRRAADGPAAARGARGVRARISASRRSTASAATSRAPPNSSAWSARRCTASSRRWASAEPRQTQNSMSRIAYVNGRYVPHRRRRGPYRGPRLPVRRRRLRGLRGQGRAAGRRAPPHRAAASARCSELRIAHADVAAPRSAWCCARRCARNRVRDGIVYLQVTRGVARRDHAFPPRRHAAERRGHREAASTRAKAEAMRGRGRRGHHGAGQPLGARRHQVGRRCCPTCSPSRRRASRAPSEAWFVDERRLRHRRLVVQRLDRHPRRQGGHAPGRHGILRGITRTVVLDVIAGARAQARGAAVHGGGGQCGARGLHHLGQPDRHAGGADRRPAGRQRRARAWLRRALRRDFHRHAEIA